MRTYSTSDGQVELSIIGYDEPNNGRELHIVKVEENGIDITKSLEPKWNRVYRKLNKFVFSKSESNFCYIPFENGGILYDSDKSEIISLKYVPVMIAHKWFIGNRFSGNQLVVVFDRLLQMVNLSSLKILNIESKKNEVFHWIEFIEEDTIEVSIYETEENGTRINRSTTRKVQFSNR